MMPILFGESPSSFENNGLGVLGEAVRCEVYEELNGAYELTMTYPMSGRLYGQLQLRRGIYAKPTPHTEPQYFRIYNISKPMHGLITLRARHISYDLAGVTVAPFSADGLTGAMEALRANAVNPCTFGFTNGFESEKAFSVPVPTTIRALLGGQSGSFLDVYGGEYAWYNNRIALLKRRGSDRGVTVRYGKNLVDLKMEQNIANVITGVYPYWYGFDGTLVEAPGKIVNAPGTFAFSRVIPLDLTGYFDTQPTPEALQARAESYISSNSIGVPEVAITVSFQPLRQTDEYKDIAPLETILLGDTVGVYCPTIDVSTTARVISTTYDVLLDRYSKVQLGRVKASIASTIAQQQMEIERLAADKYKDLLRPNSPLLDFFYPVNSVYISYSHTNPGTLFGGTWQRITNAFLWAAGASDSIGATGGEKTHTLTADELPKLSGGALFRDIDLGDSNLLLQTSGIFSKSTTAWEGTHAALTTEDKTSGYLRNRLGLDFGGDKAHNNMPPYVQVSIWRRTA